mmetsp:Transcript_24123/g.27545  ORF Transcript_24123/g.27545 Transcript_24123/m.27545 type:complete len:167 (-) Transcript_24123:423-923(-)
MLLSTLEYILIGGGIIIIFSTIYWYCYTRGCCAENDDDIDPSLYDHDDIIGSRGSPTSFVIGGDEFMFFDREMMNAELERAIEEEQMHLQLLQRQQQEERRMLILTSVIHKQVMCKILPHEKEMSSRSLAAQDESNHIINIEEGENDDEEEEHDDDDDENMKKMKI